MFLLKNELKIKFDRIIDKCSKATRALFDEDQVASSEDLEISRIRTLPRFQEFTTRLMGAPLVAPDAASFVSMYSTLIQGGLYDFDTECPEPVILDCGANIGLSAIFFKRRFPHAKVTAFEPDARVFNYLKQNLINFGFEDVVVLKKAIWKENTKLSFFSEGADGGRVQTSIDENSIVPIEAVDILDYVDRPVDFLKIDIEGSELVVLERLSPRLHLIKNVFIEYHSFGHLPQKLDQILLMLSNSGFRYHIAAPCDFAPQPLKCVPIHHGMDLLLNIFASRNLPLRA